MNEWIQFRLDALEARLNRLPAPAYAGVAVGMALVLSLFFFSPKFQLWDFRLVDNFEVSRGRTFLAQCLSPLRRDIEPAMQWRLLPPLVCHALGLQGRSALLVPWAGVIVLLGTCVGLLRREGLTRLQAALATALTGTTSAVIVPLGWLGMNDAWAWAGLAGVGVGRALAPACLLLPWVDERFVIGLPLALAVRLATAMGEENITCARLARQWVMAGWWLLPYAALRLALRARGFGDASGPFLHYVLTGFLTWLPFAPLGWWMAWRVVWVPAGLLLAGSRRLGFAGGGLVLGTLGIMVVLAADLSRSAAILLPIMLLGLIRLVRREHAQASRWLAVLLLLNLALPALHVVYVKTDLISPLPLELFRLWRKLAHPLA
jgi:hypothetical protein